MSCELYNVCACNFNDMMEIIPLCLQDIIVGTTASRKKDIATEKKDSELIHCSKGHSESNTKMNDKV